MTRVLWITLFAALVVVGARMVEYSETAKIEIVRVAGWGLLAASLVRARELRQRCRQPLDAAVLAWLGIEVLTTLTSRAPLLSVFGEQEQHEGLLTSFALAGVYAATRLAATGPAQARRTLDVWFAGAGVATVWAFLQAAGVVTIAAGHAQLGGVLRPFGTLGHPNLLGVITAAVSSVALARTLTEARGRPVHVAVCLTFAAATAITFSRGAWLALVVGWACAALLAQRTRAARPLPRWAWGAAAGAGLAGIGVAMAAGWGGVFVARLHELITPSEGSAPGRLEIWRAALAAWRARPWLGHGPDTMGLLSAEFQTPAYWRSAWGEVAYHAHSIYLHTLATRGALGIAAGGALAVSLVVGLRRGLARGGEIAGAAVAHASAFASLAIAGAFGAWGACGALIATLLAAQAAGLADSASDAPAPARSAAERRRAAPPAHGRRVITPAAAAGLVVALAMTAFAANELMGSRAIAASLIALAGATGERGEGAQLERAAVVDGAASAARRLPWDDHGPRIQATALLQWANGWPDPGPLLAEAEQAARTAARRVPLRAANDQCLADVEVQRLLHGEALDPAACDSLYATAARLWPANPYILAGWARARLVIGPPERAYPPARRLVTLYPLSGLAQLTLAEVALAARDTSTALAALAATATADWHGDAASLARAERLSRSLGRPL